MRLLALIRDGETFDMFVMSGATLAERILGARFVKLPGDDHSRTVKDLVAGSGVRFADRGTHSLKGIPDDWQLYAVELADG